MDPRDLARDTSGTRAYADFLVELAGRVPTQIIPNISVLLCHLNGEVKYVLHACSLLCQKIRAVTPTTCCGWACLMAPYKLLLRVNLAVVLVLGVKIKATGKSNSVTALKLFLYTSQSTRQLVCHVCKFGVTNTQTPVMLCTRPCY